MDCSLVYIVITVCKQRESKLEHEIRFLSVYNINFQVHVHNSSIIQAIMIKIKH